MDIEIRSLAQGFGTGILMTVLVQTTFERLTARLQIETATATALSLFHQSMPAHWRTCTSSETNPLAIS
jgi:hypothetical protein